MLEIDKRILDWYKDYCKMLETTLSDAQLLIELLQADLIDQKKEEIDVHNRNEM